MAEIKIVTSWKIFEECPICLSPKGKPCYSLKSTSKRLIENVNPHPGRKQFKNAK